MKAMGTLSSPLALLGTLSESERVERGLLHTPAEILRQPQAWRTTLRSFERVRTPLIEFLRANDIVPGSSPDLTLVLVGAGSSDHMARAAEACFRQHWGCDALSLPSTDLLTNHADYLRPSEQHLFVSLSKSGESPEAIAVVELLRKSYPAAPHILITCNAESRLANQFGTDDRFFQIVLDDSVNDRGLALTSSVTSMLIMLQTIAQIASPAEFREVVEELSVRAEDFLPQAAAIAQDLARQGCTRVCLLGDGPLNAVAREGALKVLELTGGRIMTLPQSHLGLRHGPMSAIDESTIVVSYLSSDERRRNYERDLLVELERKQLGFSRVAIASSAVSGIPVDHLLYFNSPGLTDSQRPPLDMTFAQLLGLFASMEHGLKPDRPSPNGIINPVVPPFEVY